MPSNFSRKSFPLWGSVEKYCRAGQPTDDNIIRRMRFAFFTTNAKRQRARAHTHARTRTHTHTHTLKICNTYCFSTAKIVRRQASMLRFTYIACLAERQLRDSEIQYIEGGTINKNILHHKNNELKNIFVDSVSL